MEPDECDDLLRRHRRRPWWPWLCRCGLVYPCGPRQTALDEQLRVVGREAVEWYPIYFARDAHAEATAAMTQKAPDRSERPEQRERPERDAA